MSYDYHFKYALRKNGLFHGLNIIYWVVEIVAKIHLSDDNGALLRLYSPRNSGHGTAHSPSVATIVFKIIQSTKCMNLVRKSVAQQRMPSSWGFFDRHIRLGTAR